MNLILPKTRTGLHKDLKTTFRSPKPMATTTVDDDDLVWTERTQKEIEKLYLLENGLSFVPAEYQKVMNLVFPIQERVASKAVSIPWALVMSPEQLKTSVVEFLKLSVESLNDLDLSYYLQHWKGHQSFLKKVLEHSEIQYNQLGTVTGRLVVEHGLDLLRVKRENRANVLKEHNKKVNDPNVYKFVYELDFKCLEPRVILGTVNPGNEIVNVPDIYKTFQQKFFSSNSTREEVKQAIISKLYGKLGGQKQLETIVEQEFSLRAFKESLVEQEKRNRERFGIAFITNAFGRRVSTADALPYMLPVYYTQSTAVDVALKGFAKLLEEKEELKQTRILGLIHDAMYLASPKKLEQQTESLSVTLTEFPEVRFHLGIKEIN